MNFHTGQQSLKNRVNKPQMFRQVLVNTFFHIKQYE